MQRKMKLPVLLVLIVALFIAIIRRLLNPSKDAHIEVAKEVSVESSELDNTSIHENLIERSESILTAEFGYWSSVQTQNRNDMTNLFYVFLVLATILAAGLVPAANLYFMLRDANKQLSQYAVEALIASVLIAGSILCQLFLQRLIELLEVQTTSSNNLDDISRYYTDKLASTDLNNQIPSPNLQRLLNKQHGSNYPHAVPGYISTTIIMVGGFCIGIASFIVFGFISFLSARLSPSIYSTPYFWVILVAIFLSLVGCAICLIYFRRFYFSSSKAKGIILFRRFFLLLVVAVCLFLIFMLVGFHLFPLLTNNDVKSYTMVIPISLLFFLLGVLYYWQFYHGSLGEPIRKFTIRLY